MRGDDPVQSRDAAVDSVGVRSVPAIMAERLPLEHYSLENGLPSETIVCIERDSAGFLWICGGGLSRFDGVKFKTYGVADGLPDPDVYHILETAPGEYWVSTGKGLARFWPRRQPPFEPVAGSPPLKFSLVHKDRGGRLWAVSDHDVYRIRGDTLEASHLPVVGETSFHRLIYAFCEDDLGNFWLTTENGDLYRLSADGSTRRYTSSEGIPPRVYGLAQSSPGRLLAATAGGTYAFETRGDQVFTRRIHPAGSFGPVYVDARKNIWVGLANYNLLELVPGPKGYDSRIYSTSHGLNQRQVRTLGEDAAGSLWIGMNGGGLFRCRWDGYFLFTTADGLRGTETKGIQLNRRDRLHVVRTDGVSSPFWFHQWDGMRFAVGLPKTPLRTPWTWGWGQTAFQDSRGYYWLPSADGVFRFPRVRRVEDLDRTLPDLHLTTHDGLWSNEIFRLFEDSRGDVWIASVSRWESQTGLARWERATGTVHRLAPPDKHFSWIKAFHEDRRGNVWVAQDGSVLRYRPDSVDAFTGADGLPDTQPNAFHEDSRGRLWLTTLVGLVLIEQPGQARPRFRVFTSKDGLASSQTTAMTEDKWGRLYVSGPRGLNRIDPETLMISHMPLVPGIASNKIGAGVRDSQGDLWFDVQDQILRFTPQPPSSAPPPAPLILTLQVAGRPRWISQLGEMRPTSLTLGTNERNLSIEFAAPQFRSDSLLHYQFKLDGVDTDWSTPSAQRLAQYASLAPAAYRFQARSIDDSGRLSAGIAEFQFTILAPLYRRWWFLLLCSTAICGSAFAWYRSRIQRMIQMQSLRTRIATDLHDQIGSSLTKIAVLSDVVRERADSTGAHLETISTTAREAIDALSDTVWAINPKHDDVGGLVQRTRRFAGDLLEARGVQFRITANSINPTLNAEVRHKAVLMLRECLSNAARHSDASEVDVSIQIENGQLNIMVRDNGKGFDPETPADGLGLVGLQLRAAQAGGETRIKSSPGKGTQVSIRLPLAR